MDVRQKRKRKSRGEPFFEETVSLNGVARYFLHFPKPESHAVVLFLHGGPGQSETYTAYKSVMPERNYSIVYADQRGTGRTWRKTPSRPEDVTFANLLADLEAEVRFLKSRYPGNKLVLLGHSWGSILGAEYVKRHPETVDAYIGMGQVVDFREGERIAFARLLQAASEKDRRKLAALDGYPENLTAENAGRLLARVRMAQMKYGLCGFRDGNAAILGMTFRSPVFSFADLRPLLASAKVNRNLLAFLLDYETGRFTDFRVPVCFICGREDWQVPSPAAEAWYERLRAPWKKLFWIESAGHLTDLENPRAYTAAVNEVVRVLTEGA